MRFNVNYNNGRLTWDEIDPDYSDTPKFVAFSTKTPIEVYIEQDGSPKENATDVTLSLTTTGSWDQTEIATVSLAYTAGGIYSGFLSTNTVPIVDLMRQDGDYSNDKNFVPVYIGVRFDDYAVPRLPGKLEAPVVGSSINPPDEVPIPGNAILYSQYQSLNDAQRWIAMANLGISYDSVDDKITVLLADGSPFVISQGTSGTVESVGLSLPSIFDVANSPVTTSGTLTATLVDQAANLVFAGPANGSPAAPTFRQLGLSELGGQLDLGSQVSGLLPDDNISSATAWSAKQDAINLTANTIYARASSGIAEPKPVTDEALEFIASTFWSWDELSNGLRIGNAFYGEEQIILENVGGFGFGSITTDATTNRSYVLPDLSGTIALTSQIPPSGSGGYQPYDATLAALAGLSTSANQGIYATGVDAFSTYSLTAGGRALGGVAGTANTIPYFSAANTVSLLATTTGGRALLNNAGTANTFPYYSAANTVSLSGITATGRLLANSADSAAARTTLGLGSTSSVTFRQLNLGDGTTDESQLVVTVPPDNPYTPRIRLKTPTSSGNTGFGYSDLSGGYMTAIVNGSEKASFDTNNTNFYQRTNIIELTFNPFGPATARLGELASSTINQYGDSPQRFVVMGQKTNNSNYSGIAIGHDGVGAYIDSVAAGTGVIGNLRLKHNNTDVVNISTASFQVLVNAMLSGYVVLDFANLPNSDPNETGRIWRDNATLMISHGA